MAVGSRLSFSALSGRSRSLWAKSIEPLGHGLLAHLLDVSAVAEAMLLREPETTRAMAARALGLQLEQATRWVAALVGLHDFGKAIPGFQAKWATGRVADEAVGLRFAPEICLRSDQHSLATAALLVPVLQRVTGAEQLWCQHVVQAVSAHHGYHFTSAEVVQGSPGRHEPPEWRQAREELLAAYWDVLAPQGQPITGECGLPIVNWLAGLTSAADWVASNPQWFPPGERHDELREHHQHALALANEALPKVGWHPWRSLLDAGGPGTHIDALLTRITGRPELVPRLLQRTGDEMLRQARGPTLLLVEAPMGEGKTELAFLAHLRLQSANQHRGLYLALPTQATGNALFARALTFLKHFAHGPLDLQLVHGGAAMSSDLANLRGLGELQAVGDTPADTVTANAWFGQRSRPLLSPYGVGTVDQALYAVLNVKHHFVRLWGLGNRVVVLDEVHAYDTYTSGLIDTLLRWLKALGCSVVLMSATLPRARSRELLQAWGCGDAPSQPYPRLVMADAETVRSAHVPAREVPAIELVGLGSGVEALAEVALAQVAQGGCGALIVNTVSRAQALYRLLQRGLAASGLGDSRLLLFHARFPADHRQQIELEVLSLFGPGMPRPARALLVATQVAEQSLDIDFDFMLSDLAPVDLLLQRAGRLHRHQRSHRPPAHASARLWVAGLLPEALPDLKGTAWGFVYTPYILGRTWALLTHESELRLPQDIDRLVQAVYDRDHPLPDNLNAQAIEFIETQAYGEFCASTKTQRQLAANIVIDPASEAHGAYADKLRGHEVDESGLGLANATRQGEESVTLVPVHVAADGLWHVDPRDAGFDPARSLTDTTARGLYGRQVKVARKRLVKHFQGQVRPTSFEEHALLRHMWPLCLRCDGRSQDESVSVRLDRELGLVYGDGPDAPRKLEDGE